MTPSPSRPAWVACSRARLRHNLGLLARAVGGASRVMAVLKADAYGHGAEQAALCLESAGVRSFGVATLEEGMALRRAKVKGAILLLGPLEPSLGPAASRARISASVWNRLWLDEASRFLGPRRILDVHLKVDTGMARLGVFPDEAPGFLADFAAKRWSGLSLAGAYTHLACADERRDRASMGQLEAFGALPWPQ
ncbi:MAG: alanine racemase, partial [bacterium]